MPKLNTSLCGFTKMYEDQGYDLHIVHANKPKFTAPPGFTGAFHPQTGAMVPMFKEKDGFWYLYYVVAQNAKEAYDRIRAGNVLKMLLDTGANFTLGDVKHNDFLQKKSKSNLMCRGAFGPAATRGDQMGELNVWVVHSKRADLPGYKEMTVNHVTSEAGVSDIDLEDVGTANVAETLTSFMQREMVAENGPVIGSAKNQLGGEYRKMTILECHARQGHKGHVPGCRICELAARSLSCTPALTCSPAAQ